MLLTPSLTLVFLNHFKQTLVEPFLCTHRTEITSATVQRRRWRARLSIQSGFTDIGINLTLWKRARAHQRQRKMFRTVIWSFRWKKKIMEISSQVMNSSTVMISASSWSQNTGSENQLLLRKVQNPCACGGFIRSVRQNLAPNVGTDGFNQQKLQVEEMISCMELSRC